jgi:hypothetical protein
MNRFILRLYRIKQFNHDLCRSHSNTIPITDIHVFFTLMFESLLNTHYRNL